MLKEIKQNIIDTLEQQVSGLALVKEYANEFAPGAEWNPAFPCALVRISDVTPTLKDSSNKTLRFAGEAIIYVATKNNAAVNSLELASEIYDVFDGVSVTFGEDDNFFAGYSAEAIKFFDTEYGINVHSVSINFNC